MKTILIVGGSKGIGAAITKSLKDLHQVITISRGDNPIEGITHHSLDVLIDSLPVIENLDGLVYCPGSINLKSLNRLKTEDFQSDFNINVLGAIRVIKFYENQLLKSLEA